VVRLCAVANVLDVLLHHRGGDAEISRADMEQLTQSRTSRTCSR
jgi:hypothetical protein